MGLPPSRETWTAKHGQELAWLSEGGSTRNVGLLWSEQPGDGIRMDTATVQHCGIWNPNERRKITQSQNLLSSKGPTRISRVQLLIYSGFSISIYFSHQKKR